MTKQHAECRMKTKIRNEELVTKQLILKSARKIFLEYGYQAAPLRKIASEAGYTHGALYGYFSSKEELFYAITDPVAEQLMEMSIKFKRKCRTYQKRNDCMRWEVFIMKISPKLLIS